MKAHDWRRLARVLHRDLGYLSFGLCLVYAVSGICLNHLKDWNSNHSVHRATVHTAPLAPGQMPSRDEARALLGQAGVQGGFKAHYEAGPDEIRLLFNGGTATLVRSTGTLSVEELRKRPVLNLLNRLHYNPGRWWTWVSDIFSGALALVAITGLFILPGRHGITRRGGILTALGILVPGACVYLFL